MERFKKIFESISERDYKALKLDKDVYKYNLQGKAIKIMSDLHENEITKQVEKTAKELGITFKPDRPGYALIFKVNGNVSLFVKYQDYRNMFDLQSGCNPDTESCKMFKEFLDKLAKKLK